jgi:hypothetical protein
MVHLRHAAFFYASFFGAALVFGLTGCLGPQKINKWVAQHYEEEPLAAPLKKNQPIVISSALPETGVKLSETITDVSKVLPLIFYWQYDYRCTSTLNPQLAVDNFSSTVFTRYGHGLKEKVGGNRLELRIEQMPQSFVIDDKGHIIWLIFSTAGWDKIAVEPGLKDMVISYRLLGAKNEALKKGSITVADSRKVKGLAMFKSLRKLTKQKLSEYDANIAAMTRKFLDKLEEELTGGDGVAGAGTQ